MKISMIAAIGRNRELGKNNQLIWRISSDLKRLRNLTMGHPIIMGRKTFESIGRVLPGRTNIIVTRDPSFQMEGAQVAESVEDALKQAEQSEGGSEVFVLGGAQIFNQLIDRADKLYLTVIDAGDKNADVFFPDYSRFTKVVRREKNEENGLKFEYIDLEK